MHEAHASHERTWVELAPRPNAHIVSIPSLRSLPNCTNAHPNEYPAANDAVIASGAATSLNLKYAFVVDVESSREYVRER